MRKEETTAHFFAVLYRQTLRNEARDETRGPALLFSHALSLISSYCFFSRSPEPMVPSTRMNVFMVLLIYWKTLSKNFPLTPLILHTLSCNPDQDLHQGNRRVNVKWRESGPYFEVHKPDDLCFADRHFPHRLRADVLCAWCAVQKAHNRQLRTRPENHLHDQTTHQYSLDQTNLVSVDSQPAAVCQLFRFFLHLLS